MKRAVLALLLGTYFGILLVKSEVSSWFRIDQMFRFREAHMYLIMGSAVGVGLLSVQWIKSRKWRTITDEIPEIKSKPYTTGTWLGGFLFGIGWAITGACPGPIFAQIGKGDWLALWSFLGAFCGAYLYAILRPKLPH